MSNIQFQSVTASLISTDTGSSAQFSVTNDSSKVYYVYWIDRAGKEQLYGEVDAGGTFIQPTSTSHAWEIKAADGSGFRFYPTDPGLITIGADAKPSFTDASEQITQTAHGLWSTDIGYGVINVAKSLGVTDLGSTLKIGGQNNNIALDTISASSGWAAGFTGKGVKVAVIDVGIGSNSEVSANIVGGHDFADGDENASPDTGVYKDHPLGVASIIAASHTAHNGADTMGVAPDAQLLNVRVGTSSGSSSNHMADGIRWAVDNGAKVICMPLESNSGHVDTLVADAVHYAFQHNVVTVIIGGNYSNYGPTGPALIAGIANESINVGNYNALQGTLYDSSNKAGATPMNWVVANSSGYTPTVDGGYAFHSDGGTSFAGPYVAGLAALLFQQSPNATATEIMNKITGGASLGSVTGTVINGTATADVLKATGAASMSIDGGAGIDTVAIAGNHADFNIAVSKDGYIVTDPSAHLGTMAMANVERLSFSDSTVALDVTGNGNAGEVFRLYQAAFDRTPDKGGLGFWINAMDSGYSLNNVADSFTKSAEFQKLYGATPTNEALVQAMYQNVLHRAPEKAGHDFWLNAMDHGTTVAQLLTSFSDSAENQAAAIKIIGQGVEFTPVHG